MSKTELFWFSVIVMLAVWFFYQHSRKTKGERFLYNTIEDLGRDELEGLI